MAEQPPCLCGHPFDEHYFVDNGCMYEMTRDIRGRSEFCACRTYRPDDAARQQPPAEREDA